MSETIRGSTFKDAPAEVAPVGETRLRRIAGQLQVSSDGSSYAAIGGGGTGTITSVTSTGGTVTVTNPSGPTVNLEVPAQFGSDTLIALPNSTPANVTALELITSLTTNTAGSEVSTWLIKLLQGGAQVTGLDLAAANFQGRQTFTTSGATPTATLNARNDLLVITLGADVTSLTIAGLNLDTDYRYDISGQLVGGNTAVTMKPNNTATATKWHGFFTNASTVGPLGGAAAPASDFQVIDGSDASSLPTFCASVIGVPGVVKTIRTECFVIETNPFLEHAIGSTTATTNVTSLVLAGTIKSGSVISIQRSRPTGS